MRSNRVGLGLAACALLAAALSGATESSGPFKLTRAEIEKQVAQTTGGLATSQLPTGSHGPVVVVARREQTGDAEVHENFNDIFVAHSGQASVLVGGKIDGQRLTAPGEWRGGKITGAQTYQLAPGDVLWIPAGVPHQVIVPAGGTFTYMAFKSSK
jgi:mannose-6-phosphate isomerase-like protein (cupin superfamily)